MRTRRIGAILIVLYGVAVMANGGVVAQAGGDPSDLVRAGLRLVGTVLIASGLWTGARWAWWLGIAFAGLLGVAGLMALWAALSLPVLEGRPNPTLDLAFFAVSTVLLLTAFVLLLLRSSRRTGVTGSG